MNAQRIFIPAFEAAKPRERPRPIDTRTPKDPKRRTAEEFVFDAGERRDAPSRGLFVYHVIVALALIGIAAYFAFR